MVNLVVSILRYFLLLEDTQKHVFFGCSCSLDSWFQYCVDSWFSPTSSKKLFSCYWLVLLWLLKANKIWVNAPFIQVMVRKKSDDLPKLASPLAWLNQKSARLRAHVGVLFWSLLLIFCCRMFKVGSFFFSSFSPIFGLSIALHKFHILLKKLLVIFPLYTCCSTQ